MIKIDKRNGLCKPRSAEEFLNLTKDDIDFFNFTQLRELNFSYGYIDARRIYSTDLHRTRKVSDTIDVPVGLKEFLKKLDVFIDNYGDEDIELDIYGNAECGDKEIIIRAFRQREVDEDKISKFKNLCSYLQKRLKEKEKKNDDKKERELYKKLKKKFEG